jgi:hypothetical protein
LIVHLRSNDIGRSQIRRELNAMERRVDRFGERPNRQRLREPGHSFEEDVAAGEKSDEKPVDQVLLTDDAP